MLHKILERQLKRFFGSTQTPPKEWQEFLQAISDTYVHYDEDRVLINQISAFQPPVTSPDVVGVTDVPPI